MQKNDRVAVIDNGTGFTKMGWAGNTEPSFGIFIKNLFFTDIPTVIADHVDKVNFLNIYNNLALSNS